MGYFPSDIPFMSEEERKENGITIPKDQFATDVYIYTLDLNVEKPAIEKIFAEVRTDGEHGDTDVIYWITQEDYEIWHSAFDTRMLGVVYEPLDNVVELIVRRDDPDSNIVEKIQKYLDSRVVPVRKMLDTLYKGYGALSVYITKEIKSRGVTK